MTAAKAEAAPAARRRTPRAAKAPQAKPEAAQDAPGGVLEPEPAPEPQDAPEASGTPSTETTDEAWERLTAQLEHWEFPVFWAAAWHAELDTYLDGLREDQHECERVTTPAERRADPGRIRAWEREAQERTVELHAAAHRAMLATASGQSPAPDAALDLLPEVTP